MQHFAPPPPPPNPILSSLLIFPFHINSSHTETFSTPTLYEGGGGLSQRPRDLKNPNP